MWTWSAFKYGPRPRPRPSLARRPRFAVRAYSLPNAARGRNQVLEIDGGRAPSAIRFQRSVSQYFPLFQSLHLPNFLAKRKESIKSRALGRRTLGIEICRGSRILSRSAAPRNHPDLSLSTIPAIAIGISQNVHAGSKQSALSIQLSATGKQPSAFSCFC